MTPAEESAAIARLVAADPRFREGAYILILDGVKMAQRHGPKNVPAGSLMSGVVAAALDHFGLLARGAVVALGLRSSADVAAALANLVHAKLLVWAENEVPEEFIAAIRGRDFLAEIDFACVALFDVAPPRIVAGARTR